MTEKNKTVVILGSGPAGLGAAYELVKNGAPVNIVVCDKNDAPGGLSRTIYFDGCGVDIGGHRLYTKIDYINQIWKEFLPVQTAQSKDDLVSGRNATYPKSDIEADPEKTDDVLLIRKRFSNIIFNGKFFDYPIKFNLKTLKLLGFEESTDAGIAYIKSLFFKRKEKSLEDFMINRFGNVLYEYFFKDYTKKVWGRDASEISPEWGNERIRSLSLLKTVLNSVFANKSSAKKETSLIDEFYYPKYGCSQLWNKIADYIKNYGGEFIFNSTFCGINYENDKITSVKIQTPSGERTIEADYVISTVPVKDLTCAFDAPEEIRENAENLPYRDYILVSLYTNALNLKNETDYPSVNMKTPCNWIYVQERDAVTARLQIMNNWSCYLVKEFWDKYMISLEYYANKGDELWNKSDEELVALAAAEAEKYGFFAKENVLSTKVIREEKAYPAYWGTYENIDKIKEYLSTFSNLFLAGRNGRHKYANMDEAMLSGIEEARKIIADLKDE